MIAVRLEGRLGNQLFQYAFIYATAKKLGTKFYMDKSVDYFLPGKYFNIENDFCRFFDNYLFSIKGFKNFFSHYCRWGFYYLLRHLLAPQQQVFNNNELPSAQFFKVRDNCMYLGYFQSEEYFDDYKADIKRLFSIKDVYKHRFENIFKALPMSVRYVTVHIRRTDYFQHNYLLDPAYYHKAIKSIHHDDNYYIFVSDDIDFVKTEFGYLANKYVSENDVITDFQFLANADTCILSNSSFSWWGAYLNNRNAKIIAPGYWLGNDVKQEMPAAIIPPHWTKLY